MGTCYDRESAKIKLALTKLKDGSTHGRGDMLHSETAPLELVIVTFVCAVPVTRVAPYACGSHDMPIRFGIPMYIYMALAATGRDETFRCLCMRIRKSEHSYNRPRVQ